MRQVVDRTTTMGTTWMGLTIGCAECHDHKFDAILQREFYQLYAFFNNADEVNTSTLPCRTSAKRGSMPRPRRSEAARSCWLRSRRR